MKKYIGLLLIFYVSASCVAQTNKEKEVQESVKQFFAALAAKDSVAMKRWATADLTLIEYGTVWNMDTVIRRGILQNTAADFHRSDSLVFLKTVIIGKTAWINYRLYSRVRSNGITTNIQWIETVTLEQQKATWKLSSLHSTLLHRSK